MTLFRAADIHLSFGSRTLFERLTFVIEEGERVGLVGVNGSGKSTLMKVLAQEVTPDSGTLQLKRGARVIYLPQEPTFPEGATVASELAVARKPLEDALTAHSELASAISTAASPTPQQLAELSSLSDKVEHLGGWDTEHEAKKLLDRLGVKEWDRAISELSGGLKKRVAIARALLSRPDLLLLDEPTNHLDADTVDWLEEELDRFTGALLLVTHDRYFLDDLVDRIVELEPGGTLTSFPGNYEAYLAQKLESLEVSERMAHKRDRWIAQEVAWLRKGVEARRTKSKARIDRAKKLMAQKGWSRPKTAALQLMAAPRSGEMVLEAKAVSKSFGGNKVLDGIDFLLRKGERVGLVGPNGVGKTTFLKVLLGLLPPDLGKVHEGGRTKVAYYDQARASLDEEKTVYEAAWDNDWVMMGDKRIALRDYLEDLLFPVPMQRMKVKALSGGERNRLLLARLFLSGANLLVLDEPTNDLDIVTLNVLEHLLLAFSGSVLLVTHDRYFLDKVATTILAFEGNGKVQRYEGNYENYRTVRDRVATAAPSSTPATQPRPPPEAPAAKKKSRLSYLEQREFDGLERAIEAAEKKKRTLEGQLADPATYNTAGVDISALNAELAKACLEVDRLYARWQVLEQRSGV